MAPTDPRESPASLLYTRRTVARGVHVIEQNLSVAEAVVQHRLKSPSVELPHDGAAERRIRERLAEAAIGEFAILNPGAGLGCKTLASGTLRPRGTRSCSQRCAVDCELRAG